MTDLPRNDELVRAALAGELETVKRLIKDGANPNSVDKHGIGPLLTYHPEVTQYLLEHSADPDLQCKRTPDPRSNHDERSPITEENDVRRTSDAPTGAPAAHESSAWMIPRTDAFTGPRQTK